MAGPRVRFAPSPTGFFHVGSARTSLFNWLFARQSGGTFVLRIEDTDADRGRTEWRDGILSAMAWLGFDFDEGPFFQSELLPDHVAAAEALYAAGYLYACDCTRADIDARAAKRATPGYDGYCRDRHVPRGPTAALRFRVPDDGATLVRDVIRGDVTFPHDSYEDFVVVKSNGVVLFTLANLVDDRTMGITHVIRGEDLLPTTPKQVMLWEALNACTGVEPVSLPVYAHLPMLVNEQRKKLSKRRDPVFVERYRDEGYLPDAMVNYLALLGWSPRGNEEMVSRATLVEQFRLQDVSHSPAFFDVKKLTHMNGEYIRELSVEEFIEASTPWVAPWRSEWRPSDYVVPWSEAEFDPALFARMAPLVQERVTTLAEVPAMVGFFFVEPIVDEAALAATIEDPVSRALLALALERFADAAWRAGALHETVAAMGEATGLPLRKAQAPIRLAVTGSSVGPPLFESLEVLGRERVLARIAGLLDRAPS